MSKHFFLILSLILFLACAKENDQLDLNDKYHTITDIRHFCNGGCGETQSWENKPVKLRGYLLNAPNSAELEENLAQNFFYLQDIRTGEFIQVRLMENHAFYSAFISGSPAFQELYVIGETEAIIADEGGNCSKGVVINVFGTNNISQDQTK